MYCGKCGANIKDDILFCPHCGQKVNTQQPSSEKGTGRVIPLISVAVIILSLGALAFVYRDDITSFFSSLISTEIEESDIHMDRSDILPEDDIEDNEQTDNEQSDNEKDMVAGGDKSDDRESTEIIEETEPEETEEKTEEEKVEEEEEFVTYKKIKIFSVQASSTLVAKSKDNATYGPENVIDGKYSTAWVEGMSDDGIGEFLSMDFDGTYDVDKVVIYGGFLKSKYRYSINGRPSMISIETREGTMEDLDMLVYEPGLEDIPFEEDELCPTVITFEKPVTTDYIAFILQETVSGTKYKDTAISEIEVYGKKHKKGVNN